MTTKQTNITWGIIVLVLLGVILFLVFSNRPENDSQSYQASQNIAIKTENNSPVVKDTEWITYKNTKYNFEMSVPAGNDISNTEASDIFFNSSDGQTEQIIIRIREAVMQNNNIKTPISFKNYAYMDMPRVGEGTMGGQTAAIFEAPKGSCDGPSCTKPYIAYATDRPNPMFYTLVFYGDTKLNAEEQYILDSFKFTSIETPINLETYTNPVYKYSFDYPAKYTLRVGSDRGQYLVDQASTSVVFAEPEDADLSFADFMFKRVKLLCDADGVGGSVTCPKYAKNPVAFKTTSGLTAYTLVFVEQSTEIDKNGKDISVANRDKTIYAIDLGVGPALTGGKTRIILAVLPINLEVAKNLTLSVKKTN